MVNLPSPGATVEIVRGEVDVRSCYCSKARQLDACEARHAAQVFE